MTRDGGQSSDRRTAADDKNKQMGQTMPDNKHNYEYNYDLGDVIDNAVEMGSRIGSSVLGSIADALAIPGAADIEFEPPRVMIGARPADLS